MYEQYPFDYIIGSIHAVGGVSIFNRNRWNKLTMQEKIETKEAYYEQIMLSAKSGMFDILGHIDAMRGYYPIFGDIPTDAVDKALRVSRNVMWPLRLIHRVAPRIVEAGTRQMIFLCARYIME